MIETVYGVDFSGATLPGKTTWIATLEPTAVERPALRLAELAPLSRLCRLAHRPEVLQALVQRIRESEGALWALNFPFGLPIEVMAEGCRWDEQLHFLAGWGEDAYGAGVECLRRALSRGGPKHIRRLTDMQELTPFDAYHYRIIYQTFYGMRDVLGP